MLRFVRSRYPEPCACFLDKVGDREINGAAGVIPVEVQTTEQIAAPVDGDVIMFLERIDEVLRMVFTGVLDAEVINDEVEHDWASDVLEEAGCVACGKVAVSGKVFLEF